MILGKVDFRAVMEKERPLPNGDSFYSLGRCSHPKHVCTSQRRLNMMKQKLIEPDRKQTGPQIQLEPLTALSETSRTSR